MKNFIKESMEELEHVVWPTEKETRTYLGYNLSTIIFLTILLVFMGYVIQNGLSYVRNQFPHTVESTEGPTNLDDLVKDIKVDNASEGVKTIDTTATPTTPVETTTATGA